MKTKKAIFLIKQNGANRDEGLEYIEKLKKKQEVMEVIEELNRFIIIMKDK